MNLDTERSFEFRTARPIPPVTIDAKGHLADAILQAWTWRSFRRAAQKLGADPWRKRPHFPNKAKAEAWVAIVAAWYAIVKPETVPDLPSGRNWTEGARIAMETQVALGRYGVTLRLDDEDLGWTPIVFRTKKNSMGLGFHFADGNYGLIEELNRLNPIGADESEDDYSDRIGEICGVVEARLLDELRAGRYVGYLTNSTLGTDTPQALSYELETLTSTMSLI